MYFSDSDWAVITSHHKWSFLRRLHDPPMLLYSQIELQEDNTRPFRALVAVILAAKGLITIPPPPDDLISVAHDYHAVAQQEGSGPNPSSRGDLEVCSFSSFLTLQLSVRTDSIT